MAVSDHSSRRFDEQFDNLRGADVRHVTWDQLERDAKGEGEST